MSTPTIPQFKNFLISPPVRKEMDAQDPAHPKPISVIITVVEDSSGVVHSKESIKAFLLEKKYAVKESDFYLFASLRPIDILELAEKRDWVSLIWKDETIYSHLLVSTEVIKATACWRTFESRGQGITWAILDTGIKTDHPHFHGIVDQNLSKNFSNSLTLEDTNGHGTHVAGIIAGSAKAKADGKPYQAATFIEGDDDPTIIDLHGCPSGVAPLATLVNVKVLDDNGSGSASNAILALEHLRKVNQSSRNIKIDGANMSLGYPFDPKWYGCGHSPLCDEVTRAVNSGIVVVISCGNSGYGTNKLENGQEVPQWFSLSITDPANAEVAIAVGSVHKSKPHTYGVSYFSSKGPTGDGRPKPDMVAPGEKVISCSIHLDQGYEYEERSGTSMAAPHVSGAIAAFLSAHPEYRGDPRAVKEIFLKNATDLGRNAAFQGAGMVDLMRTIMSV
jgi:subtilisin family serine protease